MLEIEKLCAGYGGKEVLHVISTGIPAGKLTAILGPNGSGKSTLLKAILGQRVRSSGRVLADGRDTDSMTNRERAKIMAYVAQTRNVPNITARMMTFHGRFPYLDFPRRYSENDVKIVQRALAAADAESYADARMTELSGGQRQRVYLAMALAQDTPVMLMDEPTTYLDAGSQLAFMETVRKMTSEGRTILIVMHDLCLAMRYADNIILIDGGHVRASGMPTELYGIPEVESIFGVAVRRIQTENGEWRYYYA